MVIPRSFEDVECAINLFGEHQASEVVGENEIGESDAGVLIPQFIGETIGPSNGDDDFAAGLRERFFEVGGECAAAEYFAPFIA